MSVHHGDALDVLATLPDCSVDAVVTDPPYGLEFMGKEWDSFKAPTGGAGFSADGMGKGFTALPSFTGSPNPTCRNCKGSQRGNDRVGFKRCRCSAPDFPNSGLKQAGAFQHWCELWARECLRILKPGGHLLAFGGTRTYHRLAAGIEDAGFEIRDSLHWIYGSGFPKSLDVSKAIDKAAGAEREVVGVRPQFPDGTRGARARLNASPDVYGDRPGLAGEIPVTAPATDAARTWQGWGTALKPAHEPIVVARKPLAGTVAANVQQHGTGALNIDGCRVAGRVPIVPQSKFTSGNVNIRTAGRSGELSEAHEGGRWPANVLFDGEAAQMLDEQSGHLTARGNRLPTKRAGGSWFGADGRYDGPVDPGDSGGASRFFPVFRYQAKAGTRERPDVDGVKHPTVKPLELMRWLVRLVTPPGGTVLDPFAGSGTTAEACEAEGFHCVAIEREAAYLPLIEARLARARDAVAAGNPQLALEVAG